MNFLKCTCSVLLAVGLLACGGGGAPETSVKVPTLSPTIDMSLVDASGVTINSKALSQTAARYLKVVLKTKVGAAAPYTLHPDHGSTGCARCGAGAYFRDWIH